MFSVIGTLMLIFIMLFNTDIIKYIDPFLNRLRKVFKNKEIHLVDERFTSSIALRAAIDGGMKKSDRRKKGALDKISASLILQSYLEQTKNNI